MANNGAFRVEPGWWRGSRGTVIKVRIWTGFVAECYIN